MSPIANLRFVKSVDQMPPRSANPCKYPMASFASLVTKPWSKKFHLKENDCHLNGNCEPISLPFKSILLPEGI